MSLAVLEEHMSGLEKVLCNLSPDLLSGADAEALVAAFSRGEKLCASGRTLLARLIADPKALARSAGITEGEAAQSEAASHGAGVRVHPA